MKLTKEHIGKKVRRVGKRPVEGILNTFSVTSSGLFLEGDNIYYAQDDEDYGIWELVPEPKQGLTLLEAYDSGRDFKTIGDPDDDYMYVRCKALSYRNTNRDVRINKRILEGRYELKPDPVRVEVTAEGLDAISSKYHRGPGVISYHDFLKKELGLA